MIQHTQRIIRLLLSLVLLLGPVGTSHGQASLLAVGSLVGAAAGLKAMLNDLVKTASDEVKQILNEALNGAADLEASMAEDLKDIEAMTMDDLDRITSNRVSDVDNVLQNAIAQLVQAGNQLDAALAQRIQDAIHQAQISWKMISQDIDQKLVRVERGVAIIVDAALIQVVRIAVIAVSAAIAVAGLLITRRTRRPGLIAAGAGGLLLIFSLTPAFASVISTFGRVSEEISLNAKLPPPEIIAVRPAVPPTYHQKGNLEFLGFNLLSPGGPSRLEWGTDQNHLSQYGPCTLTPVSAVAAMDQLTNASGAFYFRIARADTQFSQVVTVYVSKPEWIKVLVSYSVWQRGSLTATMDKTWQIRKNQDDHGWGKTTRPYNYGFSEGGWKMTSFERTYVRMNNCQDLTENIVNDELRVSFELKSGPFYDRWRGWYDADYYTPLTHTGFWSTQEQAMSGQGVYYLDPETGQVYVRLLGLFNDSYALSAYEMKIGGRFRHVSTGAQPIGLPVHISPFRGVAFSKPAEAYEIPNAAVVTIPVQSLAGYKTVGKEFCLATAPAVSGFTAAQTQYSVNVVFPQFTRSATNKYGVTPIADERGRTVMAFETRDGQLWVKWLYIAQ
jgi:hypothetical protein